MCVIKLNVCNLLPTFILIVGDSTDIPRLSAGEITGRVLLILSALIQLLVIVVVLVKMASGLSGLYLLSFI